MIKKCSICSNVSYEDRENLQYSVPQNTRICLLTGNEWPDLCEKFNLKRNCDTCVLYGVGAHPSKSFSDGLCMRIKIDAELTVEQNFEKRSNVVSECFAAGCEFYSPKEVEAIGAALGT